jgi:putative aldouronate transport system substrate-binding protein
MKKKLSLILAVLFVLALFAGCAGNSGANNGTEPENSGTDATPAADNSGGDEAQTGEEASPYNLAAGKYETDADGHPTGKYEYPLPLTTNNDVLTEWTVCWTPQYLPEDGYEGLSMYSGMQEMTGVNIEYSIIASDVRAENFSVLVNSDELTDIISQGYYFWTNGTLEDAVEDGYFANLYDYKEYMPNYLYEIYSRGEKSKTVKDTAFYKDNLWVYMCGLYSTPILNTGFMLRQDFMNDLGLGSAHDIVTYDQFHEVLKAFDTAYGDNDDFHSLTLYNTVEVAPLNFNGFNTTIYTAKLGYMRVADGQVQYCGTTDDDLSLLTMLNQWWNEGLIDPNWSSYAAGSTGMEASLANNLTGCFDFTPSTVGPHESVCIDEDCQWEPTQRMRRTEDQILSWGYSGGHITYGSATFSAKCENLPLAVSFVDWAYSEYGSEWTNWGPEGELWEYDANGNRMLTDFALHHEAGTAWLQNCYAFNELADAGIQLWKRNYAYEGGDRFVTMFDTWDVSSYYDGAYDWPTGVKLTAEQQSIVDENFSDASTYFQENISLFFTGDRPLSDWANYQQEIMDMGLAKCLEVYQEAYDEYISG